MYCYRKRNCEAPLRAPQYVLGSTSVAAAAVIAAIVAAAVAAESAASAATDKYKDKYDPNAGVVSTSTVISAEHSCIPFFALNDCSRSCRAEQTQALYLGDTPRRVFCAVCDILCVLCLSGYFIIYSVLPGGESNVG
jgi:hypothetical protein